MSGLRGDDGGVGLRTAHEKVNVGVGIGPGFADFLTGTAAVRIGSVTGHGFKVGFDEAVQNGRVCAGSVVAFK